jgi:hypothetical protein
MAKTVASKTHGAKYAGLIGIPFTVKGSMESFKEEAFIDEKKNISL